MLPAMGADLWTGVVMMAIGLALVLTLERLAAARKS
jgi:hypothetical protein